MNLWIDYKIFSLLFLSPRYNQKVKAMVDGIKDKPYYNTIQQLISLSEKEYDKIAAEFTSCFINDFPHVKCPPYESWYREKTVLGFSAQQVIEKYVKYGIYPQKQLADHISTELEFISFLLYVDKIDEAKEFFKEHLLVWTPKLVEDILNYSKGEYTKLLGLSLKQLIELSSKTLLSS